MEVSDLLGKTVFDVEKRSHPDRIIFTLEDGERYQLYHGSQCCESVYIEDINGDLEDLEGSPITLSEESTNGGHTNDGIEKWTFYRFATAKGYVTIRWHGTSNGYYGVEVDFVKVNEYND